MKKKGILVIAVGAALGLGGTLVAFGHKEEANNTRPRYEMATITRSAIEKTVSSSGKLEAVSTVSVLPQMSGRVEKVSATYNERVRKGQILVQLNTDMLKLQQRQQESAVRKAKATYDLQLLDCQNKTALAAKAVISDYDLKTSQANLEADTADLESARSALEVIQTQINQYASITSPIDGIVLACNVSAGQSVVEGSSSNSSSLFTLAADLKHMQIKASVDELDIAGIVPGQKVRFSVEALPGMSFDGTVQEIRLVPETSGNVVSYDVIVQADNKDNKLLPGLTTEVEFIEQQKTNVLVVPSAALRFQPSLTAAEIQRKVFEAGLSELPSELREAAKADFEASQKSLGATKTSGPTGLAGMVMTGPGGPPGGGGGPFGGPAAKRTASSPATESVQLPAIGSTKTVKKALWYLDAAGQLQVLMVQTGVATTTMTEVVGQDLEGRSVILKEKVGP